MQLLISYRFAIHICAAAFATTLAPGAQAADGVSWPQLEQRIDEKIETFRQRDNIIGLTVAVTKNGRLIHSKGYGSSNPAIATAMERQHRTRIGSVSKAVITGPAAYKLIKKQRINQRTKKLYGANSIFGNKYDVDLGIGNDRYKPIIAIGIAPNDKVYTWYSNRKVSTGSSNNLVQHKPPRNFSLAEGTRIKDIRAMAIASDNKVYTWYNNGGVTVGGSRDLDLHRKLEFDNNNRLKNRVKLPAGKSMLNVVGIGIAKSNDHVYIWYDDGTLSSGTSRDFTAYFVNRPYEPARNWGWRYNTRALAIASDDKTYAWYSDGKASSGNSGDLDAYRTIYDYQSATPPRRNRFKNITLQHLFDHKSGFYGGGDVGGATAMFAQQLDGTEPSYHMIHKHFLRTRPLRWAPGEKYAYSNHGMGMFTLIIKKLSGKSYRRYANNNYLRPMGLRGVVRPQRSTPDSLDSYSYTYYWDVAQQRTVHTGLPFKDSTTGLAAGGWTASAEGILAITKNLSETYTHNEIDSFGWRRRSQGKLYHTGFTGGGAAFVAIFPNPYQSASGKDLSGVHVAIAANTTYSGTLGEYTGVTGRMGTLANEIALDVADSSVPENFSLWPVGANP